MSTADLAARLRKQADELEAAQKQSEVKRTPTIVKEPTPPLSGIQAMIAAEVAKHMTPQPSPMLALVGQAFNSDQQVWISANVHSIPAFIQSENGKAALGMLLEEFQAFVKEK